MKSAHILLAVGLISFLSTSALASLPDLEVKTSIRISSVTKQEGQPTRREKDHDFRNSLFFTKSDSAYNYSLDFFLSDGGLRGRLCKLTLSGQLEDCFTIRKAQASACTIAPYNASTDIPKLKRGFTERDLKRAFDYAGIRSESARNQIARVNLALPGKASATKFNTFKVHYVKGQRIELSADRSDLAYLRARGEIACKRLYEVILPDYAGL